MKFIINRKGFVRVSKHVVSGTIIRRQCRIVPYMITFSLFLCSKK